MARETIANVDYYAPVAKDFATVSSTPKGKVEDQFQKKAENTPEKGNVEDSSNGDNAQGKNAKSVGGIRNQIPSGELGSTGSLPLAQGPVVMKLGQQMQRPSLTSDGRPMRSRISSDSVKRGLRNKDSVSEFPYN